MRRLCLVAAIAALAPVASHAAPVTIDFDNLAVNTVVGGAYAGLGVTFSNAITAAFGSLAGGTPPMAILSVSDAQFPQPANPISATFSSAISSLSLTGLDVGAAGYELTAYDALTGGNIVDTAQIFGTGVGVGNFQTLSVSGAGILRVEFSQVSAFGSDGTAWDNFVFDTAVPEPMSLALVGLGLAGLGFSRRKQ